MRLRTTWSRYSIAIAMAFAGAIASPPARSTTFTVANTNDAGPGSLRQAILDANAIQISSGGACAGHSIVFAIPGAPPHTIRPLSALPRFEIPIVLDAYTQLGASANTLLTGNNAVLGIELDGSLAGASDGLTVAALIPGGGVCGGSGSIIRGFAINRFSRSAITAGADTCTANMGCSTGGIRIQGNFIGTDTGGTQALGNGAATASAAIRWRSFSTNNVIGDQIISDGGPNTPSAANRNIIAGNAGNAIEISSPAADSHASGNRIRGNFIGLNAAGNAMVPNAGAGVVADAGSAGTVIVDNLIAGNAGDGVRIVGDPGAQVTSNCIGIGLGGSVFGNGGHGVNIRAAARAGVSNRCAFAAIGAPGIAGNAGAGIYVDDLALADSIAIGIVGNGGLGIDLAPPGVNANDALDVDTGPNDGLNTPILESASTTITAGATTIIGHVETEALISVAVYFYVSDACDSAGSGEGQQPLLNLSSLPLFVNVNTNTAGQASFTAQGQVVASGRAITAIARRFAPDVLGALEVSEFSPCVQVNIGATLFANGFE